MSIIQQPHHPGARTGRSLSGALLQWLGRSSDSPVDVAPVTIDGPRKGPLAVNEGETLTLVAGANIVNPDGDGIVVCGGTLHIRGGAVTAARFGIVVRGGTVRISSGTVAGEVGLFAEDGDVSISGGALGGEVCGAVTRRSTFSFTGGALSGKAGVQLLSRSTATLSGGSITGTQFGVINSSSTVSLSGGSLFGASKGIYNAFGTLRILGRGLQLSGSSLTGALRSGTPIATDTSGVGPGDLINELPIAPGDGAPHPARLALK